QEARPGAEGGGQLPRALAAEPARPVAAGAPLGQVLPLRTELLDATVAVVREVDRAVRPHGHPRREPELAVALAPLAPLPQQLALRGAGDDTALAERQRHVDRSVPADRDAPGGAGHRDGGQE